MNDIMKIVQALEDSNIFPKGRTKAIKSETKEQKGEVLSMLLGILGASLLGNVLTGKGIVRAVSGNRKGKRIVRAGLGNKKGKGRTMGFLILSHPLTNFGIQKYKNEPRFNGVFSRNILPEEIKDGA